MAATPEPTERQFHLIDAGYAIDMYLTEAETMYLVDKGLIFVCRTCSGGKDDGLIYHARKTDFSINNALKLFREGK